MNFIDKQFRVEIEVPSDQIEIFVNVLEAQCESVTWMLSECRTKAKVTGFSCKLLK